MTRTPEIPEWIRTFAYPGYTNVFALLPDCVRLYATETLYGDWSGELLLLAKDAAPTQVIRELVGREGVVGWRHSQRGRDSAGWKTNQRVEQFVRRVSRTHPKGQRAALYGSALANMLCDKPGWSRALPGIRVGPLHDYLVHVLIWVIGSMPRLRVVACLGEEAWYLTASLLNRRDAAQCLPAYRDNATPLAGVINGRSLFVTGHYHPAARVSKPALERGWEAVADVLNVGSITSDRRSSS
jgi:hypothetical protein